MASGIATSAETAPPAISPFNSDKRFMRPVSCRIARLRLPGGVGVVSSRRRERQHRPRAEVDLAHHMEVFARKLTYRPGRYVQRVDRKAELDLARVACGKEWRQLLEARQLARQAVVDHRLRAVPLHEHHGVQRGDSPDVITDST